MGNLLRLLSREDGISVPQHKYDLFLDFENAQPTESERETFDEIDVLLGKSELIIGEISQYKGANKEISQAIKDPNLEEQAIDAVLPLVLQLHRFYEISVQIKGVTPKIFNQLCSGDMSPMDHLKTQQALVMQFARILEFVLKFDEQKMLSPAIQNDFSYYRRLLSRKSSTHTELKDLFKTQDGDVIVDSELAGLMSFFYASPTPMLTMLSDTLTQFLKSNIIPVETVTETICTMARVCQRMVEDRELMEKFKKEETNSFVLRVMVGLVILFDHVHPVGAFGKSSNMDVKGCVRILKEQEDTKMSTSLLNALRYTTLHFNDNSTPKNIKSLLASQ